jgi:hypothetical protein
MFARRRWHFLGRLTQNPDHSNLPELYDVRVNLAVSPVVLRPTEAASLLVLARSLPVEKVQPGAGLARDRLIEFH